MKVGLHELRRAKWTDDSVLEDGSRVRLGQLGATAFKHVGDTLNHVFAARMESSSGWAVDVPEEVWQKAEVTVRYYPVLLPYDISDVKKPHPHSQTPKRVSVICGVSPDTTRHSVSGPMTYVVALQLHMTWRSPVASAELEAWKRVIGEIPGIGWYQSTATLFGFDLEPLLPRDDVREPFEVLLTPEDPQGVLGALDYLASNPVFR
jgi:hypothetical protein